MAKRISTDAKIVLTNAGYNVSYVYGGMDKLIMLKVSAWWMDEVCQLPVDGPFVDNAKIEELIDAARVANRKN